LGSSAARGDLTASYDGDLRTGPSRTAIAVIVGAVIESNRTVSASVDVALTDARGGVYRLYGVRHRRRVVLRGVNATGGRLTWRADVGPGSELHGVARIRVRHRTTRGSIVLRARPVTPPPTGTCDDAYFRDVVMTQVLVPICAQCHVPGGVAEAANFRVTR